MASKRMYEDLKEILCHELNEITRKGDIDKESLDDVYKLSSALTMVESLMKKSQQGGGEEQSEMSNRGGQSNYMPMWAYASNASNAGGSNANMSNAYAGGSNASGGSNAYNSNRNSSYENSAYDSYEGSNRGGSNRGNSSRDSYEGSNDYSEESYRRGRGANGRYVSRDSYEGGSYERGYSRHSAEEKAIMKLEEIAETTKNPKVKQTIMQAVEQLEK